MLFRRVVTQVATMLLSVTSVGLATGGVALAGLGIVLARADGGMVGVADATRLFALGVILAMTGIIGVIGIVMIRVAARRDGENSAIGGRDAWSLRIAVLAIPVALLLGVNPLVSYWRDVVELADRLDVWTTANGPSGLLFVPAAGVLLVPGLEAIAVIGVAVTCVLAVILTPSRRAARGLVTVGALLVAGLTGAIWIGVIATERLAPGIESLIRSTPDPGGQEHTRAFALLSRHRAVISGTASALSWAWAAMAALILLARANGRAATDPIPRATTGDGPTVPLDDDARRRAILDAADRLGRSTRPRQF